MSPVFRQRLLQLHLLAGLTAGLVLVVMALAGAWMVFRPQLEPLAYPGLMVVTPGRERVPLDVLAANAAAAYPGRKFNQVRFWSDPARSAMIRCSNSDQIYLDPWTGRVLGLQSRYGGLFGKAEDIHRFLGLGINVGTHVTAVAAFLFIFIILSGVVLWVPPAWRAVRGALTLKFNLSGRARLLNWHRTLGAYTAGFVLLSALTGLPHAYSWYEHGVYRVAGSPLPAAPAASPAAPDSPRVPMESLWQRAQAELPDYDSANAYFPKAGDNATLVWIVGRGAPHPHARSEYYVDAGTGTLLRATPYAASSSGHKLFYWMLAWHLGQAGGPVTQVLVFLATLGVPVLAVTGTWSYFRRRRVPAGA
ncbi:MAG: PepSY domain-containing protein [Opitutaceae bacterium]|jgi:uncharacterized iron-regulated membrane protein|nr:PepSY domain-containing protein [Opitutaceae bacterium]